MLHVTGIDLNPDSREEHLPGYTPNFPHIASLVQGARYFGGKASWHWHESVELFYVRKGAILYRTPHCEHVMRADSGGMVNSNVLHSTQILKPEADLELVLHLFSPALVAGVPGGTVEEQYVRPLVQDKEKELILLDPADAAQTETLTMLRKTFDLDETAYGYELRLQAALSEDLGAPGCTGPPAPRHRGKGRHRRAEKAQADDGLRQRPLCRENHRAHAGGCGLLQREGVLPHVSKLPAHQPHRLHPHRAAAIRL